MKTRKSNITSLLFFVLTFIQFSIPAFSGDKVTFEIPSAACRGGDISSYGLVYNDNASRETLWCPLDKVYQIKHDGVTSTYDGFDQLYIEVVDNFKHCTCNGTTYDSDYSMTLYSTNGDDVNANGGIESTTSDCTLSSYDESADYGKQTWFCALNDDRNKFLTLKISVPRTSSDMCVACTPHSNYHSFVAGIEMYSND